MGACTRGSRVGWVLALGVGCGLSIPVTAQESPNHRSAREAAIRQNAKTMHAQMRSGKAYQTHSRQKRIARPSDERGPNDSRPDQPSLYQPAALPRPPHAAISYRIIDQTPDTVKDRQPDEANEAKRSQPVKHVSRTPSEDAGQSLMDVHPTGERPHRPGSAGRTNASRGDGKTSSPSDAELFVIVLAGDTGLNAHNKRVRPQKALRHGRGYAWDWTTQKIAPLIDGHINFANIETVITSRNKLRSIPKAFNFRMHPNGARHLVDIGFNVFSLANNHSADYGRGGIRDTLRHADRLRFAGLRSHAGLGLNRDEAVKSSVFTVGRTRFGFAAMGIGARLPGVARADDKRPGQVNIHGQEDFDAVVDGLAEANADYRILSMHFGLERNVYPWPGQIKRWRDDVLLARDIDLIVGHHAHVAQGVQIADGKLIFYGLGNFLHMGMQNMSKFNACRDYGLLARVFVVRHPDGTLRAEAVQVTPLTDMHLQAKPMTGRAASRRIDILNMLATRLDDPATKSRGVRFAAQTDGTGLYCVAGAEDGPGRLGDLCREFKPPPPQSKKLSRRLRSMCGGYSQRIARKGRVNKRKAGRKSNAWKRGKIFNKR